MSERICFVGLDVHARKTAAAAVQLGSGEVFKAQIPGPPVEAIEWLKTLPGPVRAVYEAGPTGFGLVRAARAVGIEMMVCAPGAIPRQPGDRVKTDTRDALKLARLLAAGQLRPVVVPEPELEALRDLVRCREDLRSDLMACRHRITKLLLRRGLIYPGPGAAWTRRHASWLGSLTFSEPLVQVTFAEHISCHEVLLCRRDRLDDLIAEQATTGPWAALIARLRCLRGVDTLTAIGLLTEVGDFTAFAQPRRLASFVGLTPSERAPPAIAAAKPTSHPPRSTPPGAPSCDCTDAGGTSTPRAARKAPTSQSPSPANSRALSGRSLTSPTTRLRTFTHPVPGCRRRPARAKPGDPRSRYEHRPTRRRARC